MASSTRSSMPKGISPLCLASLAGNAAQVEQEITSARDSDPAGVDAPDSTGRTAVFYSCIASSVPALRKLGEAGADMNLPSPRNALTPIHMAARCYSKDVDQLIAELVAKGAKTDLHYAKTAKAAKALCAADADYMRKDKRNPNNGDASAVASMLEEYMRKLEEFTEFDANGDGELTLEEMRDGLKARQFSELEIKNMFNRLEKNENGNIGPKQYALMSIPV